MTVDIVNIADMIDLESKFEVLEAEVKEINVNKETLKRNLLDLIELQHILDKTQTFFMEVSDSGHCVCVVYMQYIFDSYKHLKMWGWQVQVGTSMS